MSPAFLTAALFAASGLCANQSARRLGPGRANFWRLAVALFCFALYALYRRSLPPAQPALLFFLAGAIGFGLGGWCLFQALPRVGTTLALLVVECAAAVFAALLGWHFLQAPLTPLQLIACALTLSGVLLGTLQGPASPRPDPLPPTPRRGFPLPPSGVLLALAAALFQAISFTLSRHAFEIAAAAHTPVDKGLAAAARLLGGALLAGLLVLLFRFLRTSPSGLPPPSTPASGPSSRSPLPLPAPAWVVLNALFGPVLGVTSMLWAISLIRNPGLVQTIAATASLLSVLPAAWLEGTRPRPIYYLGCALALAGVATLLLSHPS